MKIVSGGARTGKTHTCLQACIEDGLELVVFNDSERRRIQRTYPEISSKVKIYTFYEILNQEVFCGGKHSGFVFDNVDIMLQSLIGFSSEVKLVTTSPVEINVLSIADGKLLDHLKVDYVKTFADDELKSHHLKE